MRVQPKPVLSKSLANDDSRVAAAKWFHRTGLDDHPRLRNVQPAEKAGAPGLIVEFEGSTEDAEGQAAIAELRSRAGGLPLWLRAPPSAPERRTAWPSLDAFEANVAALGPTERAEVRQVVEERLEGGMEDPALGSAKLNHLDLLTLMEEAAARLSVEQLPSRLEQVAELSQSVCENQPELSPKLPRAVAMGHAVAAFPSIEKAEEQLDLARSFAKLPGRKGTDHPGDDRVVAAFLEAIAASGGRIQAEDNFQLARELMGLHVGPNGGLTYLHADCAALMRESPTSRTKRPPAKPSRWRRTSARQARPTPKARLRSPLGTTPL